MYLACQLPKLLASLLFLFVETILYWIQQTLHDLNSQNNDIIALNFSMNLLAESLGLLENDYKLDKNTVYPKYHLMT